MPRPIDHVRSLLFLPASNPRAVAKARTLPADLVILDLEDAVADGDKAAAREAAIAAAREDWGGRLLGVRVNGTGSSWHDDDVAALRSLAGIAVAVLPKAKDPRVVERVGERLGLPLLAMIESARGVRAACDIAALPQVTGLIAGANDLAADLRMPAASGRAGLAPSLHLILLAARAAEVAAFDGVYNRIDDAAGFEEDARAGWLAGFDGKSLIHPSQVDPTNRLFGPSPEELEEAQAMVEAARGGAERFRGRMIEVMHVAQARRTIARG